ncbi:hypothetical protein [Rikenella microfusus]|uniref:hypothetical protein n=1 Tax=Rikenella microfusus TaxID=28139 RepID=UPI00248D72D0|nr:hypothetical protein [Rikenella microfusus]
MKTIYLQRQGTTDTFNTHNAINTDLGYYIEVKAWSDNRYNIIIVSTRKQDDDTKNKRIEITAVYSSLSDAFRRVEKELREELSEDVTISDTIEKYCHNNFTYTEVVDKYLAVCFYEKSTETIRLYPENYCLVSFRHKGTKDYLRMDSATAEYLHILEEQAREYEIEKDWTCHRDKSEDFRRERFAWLIGEALKRKNCHRRFYLTDTLIK